MMEKEVEKQVV